MPTLRGIVAWLLDLKEKIERWKRRNERECNYELPVVWDISPIPGTYRVASRTMLLQELMAKSLLEFAGPPWLLDLLIEDLPIHKDPNHASNEHRNTAGRAQPNHRHD